MVMIIVVVGDYHHRRHHYRRCRHHHLVHLFCFALHFFYQAEVATFPITSVATHAAQVLAYVQLYSSL